MRTFGAEDAPRASDRASVLENALQSIRITRSAAQVSPQRYLRDGFKVKERFSGAASGNMQVTSFPSSL